MHIPSIYLAKNVYMLAPFYAKVFANPLSVDSKENPSYQLKVTLHIS